jgi:hypothetical protein
MALPDSQATSFSIKLLEGNLGDDGRTTQIDLIGTMLPFRGVSFPTKMRSKTTYYTGNPVGTQQVFGATKDPTTITGVWYDAALGNGNARALVNRIEYVVNHGFPVEVRWGGGATGGYNDVSVVRRGIIKSIDPKYEIPQIVPWTIEFEWKGEDLQTKAPTFGAGPSAIATKADEFGFLSDSLEETSTDLSSWQDSAYRILGAATGALATVNNALDDAQSAFANAMTVLDTATDVIQSGAELPANVADRVRGACDRVTSTCMGARAAFDASCGLVALQEGLTGQDWMDAAKFLNRQAKLAKLALFPTDDPLDQLDGMTQQFSVLESLDIVAQQAAQQAAILANQSQPLIIAEERPPAGSDLRDLAAKWYDGNTDLWVLIADFNDLDTSEVPVTPQGPSDLGAPPILIPDATAYAAMMAALWGAPQTDSSGSTGA